MIGFELVGASDWWLVTIGGSLDDIQVRVSVDRSDEFKVFFSLRELLELYESAYYEVPTEERESDYAASYRVIEYNDQVVVRSQLHDWEAKTSYSALRDSLDNLLSDIFNSLDQSSEIEEREEGIKHLNNEVNLDVRELYNRLSS